MSRVSTGEMSVGTNSRCNVVSDNSPSSEGCRGVPDITFGADNRNKKKQNKSLHKLLVYHKQ